MKKNSKKVIYVILLCVVCSSIVLMGFRDNNSSSHLNIEKESGENLFRGIFFLQGKVADRLGSLRAQNVGLDDMPAASRDMYLSYYNDMINLIKQNDPIFFDNFKTKIASRNYSDINEALKDGTKEFYSAVAKSPKFKSFFSKIDYLIKSGDISKFDLSTNEGQNALLKVLTENNQDSTLNSKDMIFKSGSSAKLAIPIFVLYVGVWEAVAAINAAAAINIYAAIYVKTVFYVENSSSPQVNLTKEKLISDISEL